MYNTFMADVSKLFPKTDSNLLVSVMALERKFPDMMPHVHLEVIFPKGTNLELPKYEITEKYHVQAASSQMGQEHSCCNWNDECTYYCRDCRSQNCGKNNRHC